jgi:hypothetical protein
MIVTTRAAKAVIGYERASGAYRIIVIKTETEPFLLVAVGLELQSHRILTRLFPNQVAITLGHEVIKELQPVVVVPGLVSLKPFVQFFLRKSGNWTRSRWADGV